MLSLPASVRVFVCCEPADMRRSFDSLARMAAQFTQADPLSGHLFVFCNRRADRVKILWWQTDGWTIYYRRLERGEFHLPAPGADASISAVDLMLALGGVCLEGAHRQKRYTRPDNTTISHTNASRT